VRLSGADHVVHRPTFPRSVYRDPEVTEERSTCSSCRRASEARWLHQVFPIERVLFVRAVGEAPEELGRNDVRLAPPAELLEHVAHDDLGLALGVHLGLSKKLTPASCAAAIAFARGVIAELRAVVPRAERKLAQLEPRSCRAGGSSLASSE